MWPIIGSHTTTHDRTKKKKKTKRMRKKCSFIIRTYLVYIYVYLYIIHVRVWFNFYYYYTATASGRQDGIITRWPPEGLGVFFFFFFTDFVSFHLNHAPVLASLINVLEWPVGTEKKKNKTKWRRNDLGVRSISTFLCFYIHCKTSLID